MKFTLEEIIKAVGAEILVNKCSVNNKNYNISTDTRTIKKGDIYLPLKGANFDGEKFCSDAVEKGALGCFVTKDVYPDSAEFVLKVDNTLTAYLSLAKFAREKYNPKTIAITGSSGKTTTKEMVYSVLSKKFKTQKTYSNHNNEIGLCQTVLTMPEDTEVLIIEMGMRGLGEIKLLSDYSHPDYAIITNAGSAHIGRLGSLDNIAIAKSEIISSLNKKGALIANDNPRLKKFANFDGERIFYSINDVKVIEKRPSYSKFVYKEKEYELNVEGDYNIENSLSAIEVGYKLKMTYEEVKKGLASYRPIEKRWESENVNGLNIINDSYNANPESMKASVSTFVELYPNPLVVLGDMGELGEDEVEFHREVGTYLANKVKNINNVKFITVGNLAREIGKELANSGIAVEFFNSNKEASLYILDNVNVGTTIFLKASRAMKFEEILEYLKAR